MRIRYLLALLVALPFAMLANDEDAKLEASFKEYLDGSFQLRPLSATSLGDHRFDAQLEDLTPEGRRKWRDFDQAALDALPKKIDYNGLTRDGQINFEIFKHDLQAGLWQYDNEPTFEKDPRAYSEYISDSVYLALTQSTLPKETNIANCIARMGQIPRIVAAAKANLSHPPRVHTETALKQNRGAIGFYQEDIFQEVGETSQIDALKAAAKNVVAALTDYQDFLEKDLLPRADGEWRVGPEKFAQKLDMELQTGRTAAETMADAEEEFARVRRDMYVISRQLWSGYFPRQALPPDDEAGRRFTTSEVLRRVGRDHGTAEQLATNMIARVERLKRFISDNNILHLPDPDPCQVVVMPEFKRGNSTAYMEAPPPLDPKATGHLAVSPPPADWDAARVASYLEEYNDHMLDILTIHEGYPGHAVQLQYANGNPSLIRKVLSSGAYVEGWAVYTEQMMVDQGYGGGDLALRLSQLKFYLRTVANTILDHKMHCDNMTDEAALEFLMKDCFQSEGEARLKIIRSKQSSVQLSTYFAGRMGHYRLRQAIEREMGPGFTLAAYHEAVLRPGGVPLKYLPEIVRAELGLGKGK